MTPDPSIFIRELISPVHSHSLGAEDDKGMEHQEHCIIGPTWRQNAVDALYNMWNDKSVNIMITRIMSLDSQIRKQSYFNKAEAEVMSSKFSWAYHLSPVWVCYG